MCMEEAYVLFHHSLQKELYSSSLSSSSNIQTFSAQVKGHKSPLNQQENSSQTEESKALCWSFWPLPPIAFITSLNQPVLQKPLAPNPPPPHFLLAALITMDISPFAHLSSPFSAFFTETLVLKFSLF